MGGVSRKIRGRVLLCGPSVHLTGHLGNTVSCLMQAEEDYIWRGIRFLKTKGCVFCLLLISPLTFFSSRVANVFTGDAVRVFLISSPLSLGDFLCVVVRTVCRDNKGKMCLYMCACMCKCVSVCVYVGSPYSEVILAWVCAVLRPVQNWGLQVSLSCRDMKTISLTADLTTAPQDMYFTACIKVR